MATWFKAVRFSTLTKKWLHQVRSLEFVNIRQKFSISRNIHLTNSHPWDYFSKYFWWQEKALVTLFYKPSDVVNCKWIGYLTNASDEIKKHLQCPFTWSYLETLYRQLHVFLVVQRIISSHDSSVLCSCISDDSNSANRLEVTYCIGSLRVTVVYTV